MYTYLSCLSTSAILLYGPSLIFLNQLRQLFALESVRWLLFSITFIHYIVVMVRGMFDLIIRFTILKGIIVLAASKDLAD